jgi:hypothetical protein
MSSEQPAVGSASFVRPDDATAIAMAGGVLMERYHVPFRLAISLLESAAAAAEVAPAAAARWLLKRRNLPVDRADE